MTRADRGGFRSLFDIGDGSEWIWRKLLRKERTLCVPASTLPSSKHEERGRERERRN